MLDKNSDEPVEGRMHEAFARLGEKTWRSMTAAERHRALALARPLLTKDAALEDVVLFANRLASEIRIKIENGNHVDACTEASEMAEMAAKYGVHTFERKWLMEARWALFVSREWDEDENILSILIAQGERDYADAPDTQNAIRLAGLHLNRAEARVSIGYGYRALLDYDRSIEFLERLKGIPTEACDPDNALGGAYLRRCVLRDRLGDSAGARSDLEKAKALLDFD